jgi:hypothetical protein
MTMTLETQTLSPILQHSENLNVTTFFIRKALYSGIPPLYAVGDTNSLGIKMVDHQEFWGFRKHRRIFYGGCSWVSHMGKPRMIIAQPSICDKS